MPLPVRHLPLVQNWDCHEGGNCCKEYQVTLSEDEHQRIAAQGWDQDPDLAETPLFDAVGRGAARRWQLHRGDDGSCVFLNEQGRCRIHARFGAEAKPLPCRLYPFILVPAGDHWRVGLRFACPSAAASKGRPLAEHDRDLKEFAALLARREGLSGNPSEAAVLPPRLHGRQRVAWPDLLRIAQAVLDLVRDPSDRVERRLRKCLVLADLCRQAHFERLNSGQLTEFLKVVSAGLDAETPADPASLPPPGWVGRVLFRQIVALFARKDQGPHRGLASQGRMALLRAAWRFAQGRGPVPRVNAYLPETTFEQIETQTGRLSPEAEQLLERYYSVKAASLQFCGATNFGIPFWEGLEMLTATYPVIVWLTRALARPGIEGLLLAIGLVDDHFGFNRILGSARQRLAFRLLTRTGELPRLIAWYSR
jgi:lysine-N-methylase